MPQRKKRGSALDVLVGERIRAARRSARMSQKRLAATIGVETCSIAAYEMGRKHVGAHRLCLISRALSCPVSYFFARQGEAFSRRQERGRERGSAGKHVQPQARALARAYYLINAYRLCHTG